MPAGAIRPQPRREGFPNQRSVVLPEAVVNKAMAIPLLGGVIPVAAGYYPFAEGHLVERTEPLSDAVLIFCVAGRGWVRLGTEKPHSVDADTLVFLPPGEAHIYGAADVAPWSIFWAHMRGEEVAAFRELLGVSVQNPLVRLPPGGAITCTFSEIYEYLEEDYTVPNLLSAATRLRMTLTDVHRFQARHPAARRDDPVGRTVSWMRTHIQVPADLSQLAKLAGMSATHYSAVFRRQTGYAPVDYFLRMKIQHACRLLDTTSLRIEEISGTIGYDDPFYFSRLFRRIMSQSPRAYRATPKG